MEKVKQAVWPFLGGIIVGMALLSFGFGFVSSSSAKKMANDAAQTATVAALVPTCVANAKADEAGLAAMLEKSSFQRRNDVSAAGWATYPDGASSSLKRAIDQGCVDALSA